jgi:Mg-chelatase subunit ChlD
MCSADVAPATVVWTEAFKIREGQYNVVAYLENRNPLAGVERLPYTLTLSDRDGVILEKEGETMLPPGGQYPVFEGRLMTGDRIPTSATLTLDPDPVWVRASTDREQFRVERRVIENADELPVLRAAVTNTSLTEARDIELVATIFDSRGKALTASQTYLDYFDPRTTRDIVFTWPTPIAKTVRTCEVPSDIMLILDRSGSMAADGGTPPEPLESAKRAAATFVSNLRANDMIGYVSYATQPTSPIEQLLTLDKSAAQAAIARTAMGTDGVQYTNMGEAFRVAQTELLSERHRDDARKVMVFLTDGDVTRPLNPDTNQPDREYAARYARESAARAKVDNTTIFTIGFGDAFTATNTDVQRDESLIRDLATSPQHYFTAATIAELGRVYQSISEAICEDGTARIEIIPKIRGNFAQPG